MVPIPPLNLSAPSSSGATGQVDGRSAFDASGWTVATGSARASGGTSGGMRQLGGFGAPPQQPGTQVGGYFETVPEFGAGVPSQAGGPVMWLLLLAAAGFIILR